MILQYRFGIYLEFISHAIGSQLLYIKTVDKGISSSEDIAKVFVNHNVKYFRIVAKMR